MDIGNDQDLQALIEEPEKADVELGRAGLLIQEPTIHNAVHAVLESLEVSVTSLAPGTQPPGFLKTFEIIVADEQAAAQLRRTLDELQSSGESIRPSLVAVGRKTPDEAEGPYDAFIALPSMLGELSARLSVVLYSHRALAMRYKSALEELKLNRDIFRSVTNGISVANATLPDMPLMYVNPSFELMTGYSLEEVQGKNCRFLQGEDRNQPGLTLIREAIAQKRQTVAVLRNYRKDGSCFWNELTLSPVRNREGEVTHFVGIQLDVTDRVRIENALRESEKLAAVGRLASSISHEINNPLEAVVNLVYLAAQTLPATEQTAESREYLKTAEQELERMRLITDQSLKFSRQSTRPEAILVNDLIVSSLDVYRARLRNYGVRVVTRLRSSQHVVVFQSEIRQVLSNLVNNAIDAMKKVSTRVIYIRSREATDWSTDRSGVIISVADVGSGIPQDVITEIFNAFFSTKGANGTGLGLWVSKEIVARHHGRLSVRSSTRSGRSYTVFQIFLPFQAASGEAAEDAPQPRFAR